MVNLARSPNSDRYSPNWLGPAIIQQLPWGQLAALDVLTSSIGLDLSLPPSSPAPGPSGSSPNNSLPENPHHKVATIAGICGVIFLAILVLLALLIIGYRRRTLARKLNLNFANTDIAEDKS